MSTHMILNMAPMSIAPMHTAFIVIYETPGKMNLGEPYVCFISIFRGIVDMGKEETELGLRVRLVWDGL